MCTVTFSPRRSGYALAMNRDEKLMRAPGLAPALRHFHGRVALCPSEPGGGTWIGLNDTGATLALINWYSVPAKAGAHAVSRGEVVKSALAAGHARDVDAVLTNLPLARMNPFRLIGVFPVEREVIEWQWNLRKLERHTHDWRIRTWISSGFDESGAQRTRGKTFAAALQQVSSGRTDWLRRLHRSHWPERGAYSTCMHRADAATVSYTEVAVTHRTGAMRYAPGAPCCARSYAAVRISIRGSC